MVLARAIGLFIEFADGATSGSEATLVARAREGDHQAFEGLVRRYKDRVLNLAQRIVCDADAAHDVAQETFIKAYQGLHRFRGEAQFGTWLYRIAVNEARRHVRAELRRRARWQKHRLLEAARPAASEAVEQAGALVELMQELPEKQRTALALFYLRELSVNEIAQAAGVPIGTVKARLSRGRERLRQLAQDRGLL